MKPANAARTAVPFYNARAIPIVLGIYGLALGMWFIVGTPSLTWPNTMAASSDKRAGIAQSVVVEPNPDAVSNGSRALSPGSENDVPVSGIIVPAPGTSPAIDTAAPEVVSPDTAMTPVASTPESSGAIVATEVEAPRADPADATDTSLTLAVVSSSPSPATVPTPARRSRAARDLVAAVEAGDLARARVLAAAGSSLRGVTEQGESLLMRASWHGHNEMVSWLLDAGASPNFQTAKGQSALINAAIRGHDTVVGALLDAGASVNHASRDGRTGLMAAAWNGHGTVVQLLIQRGASVGATDRLGRTALHYAAASGRERSAAILVEHGASLTARDTSGRSSRELARSSGLELEESRR